MITGNEKCVCKICECGRHKCPHKSKRVEQWGRDVCSEYRHQYLERNIDKVCSFKPPNNAICNDEPLSTKTTNRVDYIEHDVCPPLKHQHPLYEKPDTPMDTLSSYRNEYTEKPQCATRPIKPIPEKRDSGKFQSETTNRSAYVPWDVCPPERRQINPYVPCKEPLSTMTSNRADYVAHDVQHNHSYKPPVNSLQTNTPFANMTEQRANYISHNVEPPMLHLPTAYHKPEAPFDGRTTNRDNYVAHDMMKINSCKPPQHKVDTSLPFANQTTNRLDYIAHDTKCPEKWEPEKYVKPEGDMDLLSTYRLQYVEQPSSTVAPIKPVHSIVSNEPFDGQTSYRQNYVNHENCSNIVYHKEKYVPPTAPFDSQTTNRVSYIPHNCDPTPSCKPPPHAVEHHPFDDKTQYRSEFFGKEIPVCPAARLAEENYVYTGEDDDGHKYFTKDGVRTNVINTSVAA